MAAIDVVLAALGVEDILTGVGKANVPTSGGGTREINGFGTRFPEGAWNTGTTAWDAGTAISTVYGFTATDNVVLATEAGKKVTVGLVSVAATTEQTVLYGLTTFKGNATHEGALTMASGTTLAAQTLTVATALTSTAGTTTLGAVAGAITGSATWLLDGTFQTRENTILANASNKTVQLGSSGAAASTAVTTIYGQTSMVGNLVLGAGCNVSVASGTKVTFAGMTDPVTMDKGKVNTTLQVAGASLGSYAFSTTTLATSGNAYVGGQLIVNDGTAGIDLGGASITYDSGTGTTTIEGNLYTTGTISGLTTSATFSSFIKLGSTAEFRLDGVGVGTVAATLDITDKTLFIYNDSTGGPTSITTITNTNATSHIVYIYNYSTGTDTPVIAAGLMESGSALTIAAGKGVTLYWSAGIGKFLNLSNN